MNGEKISQEGSSIFTASKYTGCHQINIFAQSFSGYMRRDLLFMLLNKGRIYRSFCWVTEIQSFFPFLLCNSDK